MKLVPAVVCVLAAFGLTVGLNGQASVPQATLRASERQFLMGRIQVESLAARQTRIQFWLNTATYLAKQVVLEADRFAIRRDPNGGLLIESAGPVRLTGFTLDRDINNAVVLKNGEDNVLTWDRAFTLRILVDGTPEWGCCPRKE